MLAPHGRFVDTVQLPWFARCQARLPLSNSQRLRHVLKKRCCYRALPNGPGTPRAQKTLLLESLAERPWDATERMARSSERLSGCFSASGTCDGDSAPPPGLHFAGIQLVCSARRPADNNGSLFLVMLAVRLRACITGVQNVSILEAAASRDVVAACTVHAHVHVCAKKKAARPQAYLLCQFFLWQCARTFGGNAHAHSTAMHTHTLHFPSSAGQTASIHTFWGVTGAAADEVTHLPPEVYTHHPSTNLPTFPRVSRGQQ